MVVYDLGEIGERIRLYGSTVLGVLLASSLLAFLLSSRLRAVIATPISQLVHATTSVAETGDYSIRAEKLSGDEMGVLVDRFNEMLAGIQSRDNELRKALLEREAALLEVEKERERFHFMAESMPQKIFTAKPNGDVDYFNRQWLEFTGLSFEQIRDLGWTQFVHPDDVEENVQTWRQSVQTGEPFRFRAPVPATRKGNTDGISAGRRPCGMHREHFHVDRIQYGHPRTEGKGRGIAEGQ